MNVPKLVKIQQHFSDDRIEDIKSHLLNELKSHSSLLQEGKKIAITVGSRGINNGVLVVRTIVEFLQAKKCHPFVIGAMGSHGGGTPEGQMDVLHSLGYTEENVGCSVITSSDVLDVATTENGLKVFCDKHAWEADGIIVMNRVKLHTSFHGLNESGLLKMITVGLGKVNGANQLHKQGPSSMSETIRDIGKAFLDTGKILFGIGIVENSLDKIAHLEVIPPKEIIHREQELLKLAKLHFPMLPIDELDVLIIKNMGKNFSGTGMDTNVIGRTKIFGVPEPESPSYKRIVVLDLDEASHGNANGIGLADITTERLRNKMDNKKTYLNCITSTYIQRGMLPVVMPTEKEAIMTAFESLGMDDYRDARVAIIENTLELKEMYVSDNLISQLKNKVSVLSEPIDFFFD